MLVVGSQAAGIVEAAGLPPEQSLSQLWAEGRHELQNGQYTSIRLLGVQGQLVGSHRVASVLLMRTSPSLFLPSEEVCLLCFAHMFLLYRGDIGRAWIASSVITPYAGAF